MFSETSKVYVYVKFLTRTLGDCAQLNANAFSTYILIQHRNGVLSSELVENEYEPDESPAESQEERHMQHCLNNTDHMLRMYGTAREFCDHLKIYKNFPGSHEYLNCPVSDLFKTTPMMYDSLKNEKYILKTDLLVLTRNLILSTLKDALCNVLVSPISVYFIGRERILNEKRIEFVRYDEKVFKGIEKEFLEFSKNQNQNGSTPSVNELSACNFDQIYDHFKAIHPTKFSEIEDEFLRNELSDFHDQLPIGRRATFFEVYLRNLKIVIDDAQSTVAKHPEWFLPYPKTHPMLRVVRVFEDGKRRFVMISELLSTMNQTYADAEFTYRTVQFENIKANVGSTLNNIEFIRTPIIRAKHKAVPIKTDDGFCILAVDALFDLLKHLIFGAKLFQQGTVVEPAVFSRLEQLFSPRAADRYFIDLKHYDIYREKLMEMLNCSEYSMKLKDVRNAKKDGFSVENLRNELRHLNLTEMFPEILDYAGIVYEWVDNMKNEEVLRTCDLFDAVEMCQLICIFRKFSNLRQFLHFQEACGRVLTLQCDSCEDASRMAWKPLRTPPESSKSSSSNPSPGSQNSTSSVSSERKKDSKAGKAPDSSPWIQNAPEGTFRNQKLTSPASVKPPDSAMNQKATSSSVDSESSKLPKKSNQKKAPESARKSSEAPPPPPPAKKESANCVKCYRTCEMLNETKKELKSTQNKLAMYEKKNLEMDKEKKKKNERILEEQEEKIAKLQKGLEAKNTEIEELKKKNERIVEKKNGELEEMYREFRVLYKKLADGIDREQENQKLKEEILKLKGENLSQKEEFVNQKEYLQRELIEMRPELADAKEKIDKLNHENRRYEAEILERTEENQRLNVENVRLRSENETKERMIQQLIDRLATSGIQNLDSEDVTTSQYSETPEYASEGVTSPSESPSSQEEESVQPVVTASQMTPAPSESYQEKRIRIPWFAAMTGSWATTSDSGPAFEMRSGTSLETTLLFPNQKYSINPESADLECPICLDEVEPKSKKINCNQCKKQFHSHCASTWLRVKSECPACRGRLLDPNEFPTLS
ncbi:hypothetical protein GCK72_003960 [Caenorhabditis remanei]|uniref:RING-type domain-containing protein n=1 Tax=Caenorhabditis remanei TaxID=31234 RepID=A0A6A5HB06_CAERE|nr:hypothetical protein GCK72_003960 [Caenorhabditis remanei]KAF1764014.1 hypothetical protein GCK72_003960 [Caenorhabditis remanei]